MYISHEVRFSVLLTKIFITQEVINMNQKNYELFTTLIDGTVPPGAETKTSTDSISELNYGLVSITIDGSVPVAKKELSSYVPAKSKQTEPLCFVFDGPTPSDIDQAVMLLSSKGQNQFRATDAWVSYNTQKYVPFTSNKEVHYPLILKGSFGETDAVVKIRGISCGFNSLSSFVTYHILKSFGFHVRKDDIMTMRKVDSEGWINLTYERM